MKNLAKQLLRRGWRVAHRLAPGAAERIDDRRRARRRAAAAVTGLVQFEERIAGLERDLALVSTQLATLTMRIERPSAQSDATSSAPAGEEERVLKARLSAISFYEERISRLEVAAGVAAPEEPSSPR